MYKMMHEQGVVL
ncbi:hypothetical protein F0226_03355 [Vibrio sp. 99-70-13A1]|nr:hypothetical protein [Vibrio sp. 99-70-13A1]